MFSRLFARRGPPPEQRPSKVPEGSRIYAVGDIHGCVDLLRKLQAMILNDAAAYDGERKVVIYLGDYIDRGVDSRAVIDRLIDEPLSGFESIFLKGNHEETLLRFLDDPQIASSWMAYGGDAALYSYGIRPPDCTKPDELLIAQRSFAEALPVSHLRFLQAARVLHIEGDYAFVHAGLRENVAIEHQSVDDMLWIRDEFLQSRADFGKIVVHGHSIAESPVVQCNKIGIDTGAFATGRLTCLVLEGDQRRFLAT
jgi:serine/threonine protein phosphatase 1